MTSSDASNIAEILRAADLVLSFVRGIDKERFALDLLRRKAVTGRIIAMAGSAKGVSEVFRSGHPEIGWDRVIAMGDQLIRGSEDANPESVWTFATEFLPDIIARLTRPAAEIPHS
jgi:uncharacterized protein with HEPN domain